LHALHLIEHRHLVKDVCNFLIGKMTLLCHKRFSGGGDAVLCRYILTISCTLVACSAVLLFRMRSSRGNRSVEPLWRGELSFGKVPTVDIAEKEKEYELPGMDEKNIDVKFADGVLTIKGEKSEEKEEKKKDYYLSERRFGSFQRSFQVPAGVEADKIEASLKNGVLTVVLPKSAEAQKARKRSQLRRPERLRFFWRTQGTRREGFHQ
jgi:HSP20 family molecular chaperone IbpA